MISRPKTITAAEAKELSAVAEPASVEHYLLALSLRIRELAKEGKRTLDPWACIASLREVYPTPQQKDAIRKHFEQDGFKWTDHPDPDPGHPCSRPYTTIAW